LCDDLKELLREFGDQSAIMWGSPFVGRGGLGQHTITNHRTHGKLGGLFH